MASRVPGGVRVGTAPVESRGGHGREVVNLLFKGPSFTPSSNAARCRPV